MNSPLATLKIRRAYFDRHLPKLKGADRRNDIKGLGNTCPSCGYPTLEERCAWEICSICFWEDDGQDDMDADQVFGGPNYEYSLTAHRLEWADYLDELKKEKSETGLLLARIDELIKKDEYSDIKEVLKIVSSIAEWFDARRDIKK